MRPKTIPIAKVVKNTDGTMEIFFEEGTNAKSAEFTTDDGGKVKFINPRGLYQASDRIKEISIRG
jgi:hypothetical protein